MPGTPTTIHGIPTMGGGDAINQIDEWTVAAGAVIDGKLAPSTQGVLSALPPAGKIGRTYWATDTKQLFRDNGSGWDEVVVAGTTPPALGVPAQQAWQTLAFTSGLSGNLAYYKDSLGIVHFRGDPHTGVTLGIGNAMGTMPAGYRPGIAVRFPMAIGTAWAGSGVSSPPSIEIGSDGVLKASDVLTGTSGLSWSVGAVSYRAEN